jgi:serine O-acetyltransferase
MIASQPMTLPSGHITVLDLVLIYALPVLAVVLAWLLVSVVMLAAFRSDREFPLKADFVRRVTVKQRLASGVNTRLNLRFVAQLLLADSATQAIVLYRLSRWFWVRGKRPPAQAIHAFSKFLTRADLNPGSDIGPGFFLYHGGGTVIGRGSTVGPNGLICQGVTLGGGHVVLGEGVSVWAGAKVIGNVVVGDGADVGANAVVVKNVPAGMVAVGVPARSQPRGKQTGTSLD